MKFSTVPWLLFGAVATFHVCAQTYPAKPIRIIVSYPAGGANDIVARSVGQKLN
jgi:tripartite-type tricarboxylate transporter receptor subunit TctC